MSRSQPMSRSPTTDDYYYPCDPDVPIPDPAQPPPDPGPKIPTQVEEEFQLVTLKDNIGLQIGISTNTSSTPGREHCKGGEDVVMICIDCD